MWRNRHGNSTEHNRHAMSNRYAEIVRLCVFRRLLAPHLTSRKQQSRRSCLACESQRCRPSNREKPDSSSRHVVSVTSVAVDEPDAPSRLWRLGTLARPRTGWSAPRSRHAALTNQGRRPVRCEETSPIAHSVRLPRRASFSQRKPQPHVASLVVTIASCADCAVQNRSSRQARCSANHAARRVA